MLTISLAVIAASFVLMKFPPSDATYTTVFLGITFVLDAVANVFSMLWTAKYEAAERREIEEEIKASLEAARPE